MEHTCISTLCAAGTVGIAATGFALARHDEHPQQQQQQHPSPLPAAPPSPEHTSRRLRLRKKVSRSASRLFSPSTSSSFSVRSSFSRLFNMSSPAPSPRPAQHQNRDAQQQQRRPSHGTPTAPTPGYVHVAPSPATAQGTGTPRVRRERKPRPHSRQRSNPPSEPEPEPQPQPDTATAGHDHGRARQSAPRHSRRNHHSRHRSRSHHRQSKQQKTPRPSNDDVQRPHDSAEPSGVRPVTKARKVGKSRHTVPASVPATATASVDRCNRSTLPDVGNANSTPTATATATATLDGRDFDQDRRFRPLGRVSAAAPAAAQEINDNATTTTTTACNPPPPPPPLQSERDSHRHRRRVPQHSQLTPELLPSSQLQTPASSIPTPTPTPRHQRTKLPPWMKRRSNQSNASSPFTASPATMADGNDENNGQLQQQQQMQQRHRQRQSHDKHTRSNRPALRSSSPEPEEPPMLVSAYPEQPIETPQPRHLKKAKQLHKPPIPKERNDALMDGLNDTYATSAAVHQDPAAVTDEDPSCSDMLSSSFWRRQANRRQRPKSLTFSEEPLLSYNGESHHHHHHHHHGAGKDASAIHHRPCTPGDFGLTQQPLHERECSSMETAWRPYFSPVSNPNNDDEDVVSPTFSCRGGGPTKSPLPTFSPDPSAPPTLMLASNVNVASPTAKCAARDPPYLLSPVKSEGQGSPLMGEDVMREIMEGALFDDEEARRDRAQYPGSWKLSRAKMLRRDKPSVKHAFAEQAQAQAPMSSSTPDRDEEHRVQEQQQRRPRTPPMISHSLPLRRKRSFEQSPALHQSPQFQAEAETEASRHAYERDAMSTFPRAAASRLRLRHHPAQPTLRPDVHAPWSWSTRAANRDSAVVMAQRRLSSLTIDGDGDGDGDDRAPTLVDTMASGSSRTYVTDEEVEWSDSAFGGTLRKLRLGRVSPGARHRQKGQKGPSLEDIFVKPTAIGEKEDADKDKVAMEALINDLERTNEVKDARANLRSQGDDQRGKPGGEDQLRHGPRDAAMQQQQQSHHGGAGLQQESSSEALSEIRESESSSQSQSQTQPRARLAPMIAFPVHSRKYSSMDEHLSTTGKMNGDDSFSAGWDEAEDPPARSASARLHPADVIKPRPRPGRHGVKVSRSVSNTSTNRRMRIRPDSAVLLQEKASLETSPSVFDWSEQQLDVAAERERENGEKVRPKTVHAKTQVLNRPRGSRESLTRKTSAVHLRSKSVPIAKDSLVNGLSNPSMVKFATWGLGTKGVSEDWDGDFDFAEEDEFDEFCDDEDLPENGEPKQLLSPGATMRVPKSIMKCQASVHGQYGQVQELTLLVEELKRLVARGTVLKLTGSSDLWKEAKGIIHLATFEDEEGDDATKEEEVAIARNVAHLNIANGRHSVSPAVSFDSVEAAFASINSSPVSRRRSRGSENGSGVNPNVKIKAATVNLAKLQPSSDLSQRGSEEKLRSSEKPPPITTNKTTRNNKEKLPFDTQSLKALVSRANAITRSLKDLIRGAEGVADTSPSLRDSPIPNGSNLSRQSSTSSSPSQQPDGERRAVRRLSQMFVEPLHENESELSVLTSSSAHQGRGRGRGRGNTEAGPGPSLLSVA